MRVLFTSTVNFCSISAHEVLFGMQVMNIWRCNLLLKLNKNNRSNNNTVLIEICTVWRGYVAAQYATTRNYFIDIENLMNVKNVLIVPSIFFFIRKIYMYIIYYFWLSLKLHQLLSAEGDCLHLSLPYSPSSVSLQHHLLSSAGPLS